MAAEAHRLYHLHPAAQKLDFAPLMTVVLGNLILRCDRAESRAVGVFGESDFGLYSPGVAGR